MSSRLPKHLHDALTAARLAIGFVGARDLPAYAGDVLLRSAVERQLEILGEACRRALEDEPELLERLPQAKLAVAPSATASSTATTASSMPSCRTP